VVGTAAAAARAEMEAVEEEGAMVAGEAARGKPAHASESCQQKTARRKRRSS
jgi:hypothetical protein